MKSCNSYHTWCVLRSPLGIMSITKVERIGSILNREFQEEVIIEIKKRDPNPNFHMWGFAADTQDQRWLRELHNKFDLNKRLNFRLLNPRYFS